MSSSMGSSPIFYENGSWYHRTKSLSENLQIEYGKKGGYQTEDEAAEAYVEHLSIFKNRLALLKEKQTPQFSFKDYLVYWHHSRPFGELLEQFAREVAVDPLSFGRSMEVRRMRMPCVRRYIFYLLIRSCGEGPFRQWIRTSSGSRKSGFMGLTWTDMCCSIQRRIYIREPATSACRS